MLQKEFLKRYVCYLVGLYILSFGISMIFLSGTGTSPISSWAFVMDKNTPFSAGTYTFIINMVMVVGQVRILRKHGLRREKWNIMLQIPFSAVFGIFIDSARNSIQWMIDCCGLNDMPYWGCFLMLSLGILIQSYGVFLEVRPHVTMMSAEAFVNYYCSRTHKEFGACKVWFDVSLVLLAVVCSVGFECWKAESITLQTIADGAFDAVREGTLLAALFVGRLVTKIKNRYGELLDSWFCKE